MTKTKLEKLMKETDKTKLPKHWRKFINKQTVEHNIILKCGKRAFCTHCQKYFDEDVTVHPYHKAKCKWCNKEYYVSNHNVRKVSFLKDVAFFTKVGKMVVLRVFEVESKYDHTKRKFIHDLQEYVRFIPGVGIIRSDAISFFMYYMKVYHNVKKQKWCEYTGNKLLWHMSIYPYNKKHLYKNTALQYAPIDELKEEYNHFRDLKILHIASFESFEYLWKMGLHELALAANKFKKKGSFYKCFGLPKTYYNFMLQHNINYYEYRVLKLLQKQDIDLIRSYKKYNYNYLVFMKKQGYLHDREVLDKFCYSEDVIRAICKYVPLKKLLEYPKGLNNLHIYKDYLEMADKLALNYTSKKDLFPRNLIARHDKLQAKQKIIKDMDTQFGISLRYLKLAKYVYQDGKYIIFPAQSVEEFVREGKQQGNCVARIYMDRYQKGETEIFFIRKLKDVNKSFITLEFKGGRVVQKELPHHSTAFKKEHLEFIEKWQGYRIFIDNKEKYSRKNKIADKKYYLNKLVA